MVSFLLFMSQIIMSHVFQLFFAQSNYSANDLSFAICIKRMDKVWWKLPFLSGLFPLNYFCFFVFSVPSHYSLVYCFFFIFFLCLFVWSLLLSAKESFCFYTIIPSIVYTFQYHECVTFNRTIVVILTPYIRLNIFFWHLFEWLTKTWHVFSIEEKDV